MGGRSRSRSAVEVRTLVDEGVVRGPVLTADPVLRVNAAGILAKTGSPELADGVALGLARDQSMRDRYLTGSSASTSTRSAPEAVNERRQDEVAVVTR